MGRELVALGLAFLLAACSAARAAGSVCPPSRCSCSRASSSGPTRRARSIATSLLARGEFALILVALATEAGLDPRFTPFVALYVLVLAVASPILASQSDHLARLLPVRWFPANLSGFPSEDQS
jgi:Kef-type K+ transport system membrane component KefB